MHIGIDPGLRGAIVGVNDDGSLGVVWDIPTHNVRGHTSVDENRLADDITKLASFGIQSLTVEEPFYKPDRSYKAGEYKLAPQAAMKARINSGVIYGMCKMAYRDTQLVLPAAWKRSVGIARGSGKEASIKMAQGMWTEHADRLHKDGRADAALIAYHGMRNARLLERNVDMGIQR